MPLRILLLSFAAPLLLAAAEPAKLTIDDLLRIAGGAGRGAGAAAGSVSPDGTKRVYVSEGDIWIAPVSGGEPRRLTQGAPGPGDPRGAADSSPRWNPKGRWIFFQSGRHGQDELYVVSEDGGEPIFLAPAEIYNGADHLVGPAAPDRGDAVSVDRFDPNPEWSPDGARISYTERSRQYFSGKLNILAFDRESGHAQGKPHTIYTAPNDRGGAWAINTAVWAPDGKRLAIVLQQTGWDKLFLISPEGGKPRPLTTGEGEDENPVYSHDGKSIAFVSNRGVPEERHVWIVPASGGKPRRLTDFTANIESSPVWSADDRSIAISRTGPFEPGARFTVDVATGKASALDPARDTPFAHGGIAAPEVVHFRSRKDGLPIAGILYKPLGYTAGQTCPLVVWAHGGPEGQDALTFSPWSIFLAQQGYLVLLPNFRGSTGYGEKFRNANVEDSGGGEIDDVASGIRYLIDKGLADPKRVAIGGGSHGGTVVANAVTKLPGTFAAAIQLYGVTDRATFLERTNRNSKIRWETKMGGTPAQKPAVYRKANVIPDVAKIDAPLLIMHGEEDPQVPPRESAQFVEALKAAGKPYLGNYIVD
jgi:dipeptidyl aminopeptidase/acylaminoacyl peptidase